MINPFKPNELYILKVAYAMYRITQPWEKDNVGFNRIEAWLFRDMMLKDISAFTLENLEWMRRSLLKYRKQIQGLGYDMKKLQEPVADKAVFGWKTLADSKFLGAEIDYDSKELKVTFKWRRFKDHKVEKIVIHLDKNEGLKLLIELEYITKPKDADDLTMKISYYPESSVHLLKRFGIQNA